MAGMCCGVVGDSDAAAPIEQSSRALKRRKMEVRQLKFVADVARPAAEESGKRQRIGISPETDESNLGLCVDKTSPAAEDRPRYGVTSVCGRRRDMEDAVAIHPSFCRQEKTHFFGVFDGHGCSHVAMRCKARLHEIVRQDVDSVAGGEPVRWKDALERSFDRMDKEVHVYGGDAPNCRCELQTPHCDAVGSTAVVAIVTPDKIIVSNCGDSRAVLSRNGVAVPLSSDHKPDRPDELKRIEAAGGRVIYWDGARVLGVLAMSRAIGDSYLKPFVTSEPEVTVIERSPDDECLILGSDGLWDVISNETACGVARMCLKSQNPTADKHCSDATILLTKLALARNSTDNVSVVVVDLRTGADQ